MSIQSLSFFKYKKHFLDKTTPLCNYKNILALSDKFSFLGLAKIRLIQLPVIIQTEKLGIVTSILSKFKIWTITHVQI